MKKVLAVMAVAGFAAAAQASVTDIVLIIDWSTVNQVTISATTGVSAATVSGSNVTGFYFADLFNGSGAIGTNTLVPGATLSSFNDPPDGTPALYRDTTTDPGLNIWSFSTSSTVSFTASTQAFNGSATWNVTPSFYALIVGANASGNVYFPADDVGDLPNAQVIGQYLVVPAPGAVALLGLGGLLLARRRR